MTRLRSRLCPWCKGIVAEDARECPRCGRRQPGAVGRLVFDLAETAGASGAPVTALVGLVNVAVFAATYASRTQLKHLIAGASRARMVASGALLPPLTNGEPWRLVSAGWVHFGLLHLGLNMLALLRFGADAERLVGPSRFAVAYVVTGVAGFAASQALSPPGVITGGASASIFGVLGLLLGWLVARKDPRWKEFASYTVLSALAFGFLPGMNVNNAAHIGGLGAGLVFGAVFARERRPWHRSTLFAVLAVVAGVSVLGSLALSRRSPISQVLLDRERRILELEGALD